MGSVTTPNYEVLNDNLTSKIDKILSENDNDSTKLVGILLDVQDIVPKKFIPMDVAAYVAEKLNVPLTGVYDVISFYASLSEKPRAEHVINLCKSVVCRVNNYMDLEKSLENVLGIKVGEATADGRFALQYSACFGACDVAPAIKIDTQVYGRLTEEKLKEVIESYR
ncbi:MAG: NAD(P)H-dependent oxidoreductase subunit E [Clostridia bacterium]|nr:NAD(P)H-dependent oxidoreductase subunit E [Clostridia bacterium]